MPGTPGNVGRVRVVTAAANAVGTESPFKARRRNQWVDAAASPSTSKVTAVVVEKGR
ncbi:MAG: hypothetical protein FD126_263 [Elusimicrobia bacterium]|nr:MAG: hypothetical protein FD126_263 [Elusimicrobiota bacterium]